MPTIYIDDQPFEVQEGENVLQAALEAGLDLPYFCWHPEMGSIGACRQCAIVQYRDADDTRGRIVMGCMTPVADGARFSMQGETASEFRENIVESLMINHPHDCPVCAEGGECHLQDMTVMVGHRDRRYRGKKNTHKNQNLGPLINHEMNRCIACYRCTRFYQDYAGGTDLAAHAAHDHVYFGRHQEGTLESEFAGNLVEVCPTGVFTDKPLVNDYTRKWDLQSAPSVCGACALGCNTLPGERYGKLKRVHNRYNDEVNGYFLCDRGRYGHTFVNDEQRPLYSARRTEQGKFDAIDETTAIETVADWLQNTTTVAVGSPRASMESNFLLEQLVGSSAFCNGMADAENELVREIIKTLSNGSVSSPSLHDIEDADAVFILGEDVTNTAPRLALSLRQTVRNKAKQLATELRIPLWQDEAVRNLAQDRLSPLYIAASHTTRLDDIAAESVTASNNEIARLGFAVAAIIDPSLPAVSGLDESLEDLAQTIAQSLGDAEAPLIVSGTGAQNLDVIKAAAAISHALQRETPDKNVGLSYCLAEGNTMGVGLMNSVDHLSFKALVEQAKNGAVETLLVLENDLHRRLPESQLDQLMAAVKNLVVIDSMPNQTMDAASMVLPAATLIESEGTLVSSEGRAQRHFPVFLAAEQRAPAWQWLTKLGKVRGKTAFKDIQYFDDACDACAENHPALAGIVEAAPDASFKNRGLKIPRQPHRYSGRTAMLANISVHEPQQPEDRGTALAYSMEGRNDTQPGALMPFVWAPGWNSNQSLQKFQSEVGGPLKGGTAGKRLIEPRSATIFGRDYTVPAAVHLQNEQFSVLPIYSIFGSDEMSAHSEPIKALSPTEFVRLNSETAKSLSLHEGDPLGVHVDGHHLLLRTSIDDSIPAKSIGIGVGFTGFPYLTPNQPASLEKIGDGGGHV